MRHAALARYTNGTLATPPLRRTPGLGMLQLSNDRQATFSSDRDIFA
jgi:hypothetical protein